MPVSLVGLEALGQIQAPEPRKAGSKLERAHKRSLLGCPQLPARVKRLPGLGAARVGAQRVRIPHGRLAKAAEVGKGAPAQQARRRRVAQ